MVDIDLLVKELRRTGYRVETVYAVPENAGDYELSVDGEIVPLERARQMLESKYDTEGSSSYRRSA